MPRLPSALACAFALGSFLHAQDPAPDDRFLAGYAAAVLEREFSLRATGLVVVAGEVRYPDRGFGTLEREQIEKSLRAIPGVRSVTIIPATGDAASNLDPAQPSLRADAEPRTAFLAPGRLFDALLADPRWPHFYAAFDYYLEDGARGGSTKKIEQVGSAGFGETLSMIRRSHANGWRWEAGLQAGVFSIFDLDSESMDLINADYTLGPYAALRHGDLSILTRIYHQSSHLGDEYILREQITGGDRVNLSYEAIDVLGSYELPGGFRLYAGGAYLMATDPAGLEPWIAQYGGEWRAPFAFGADSGLRPIFAADFQHRDEYDMDADYSIRAGVQFEDPGQFSRSIALMAEFYDGRSPNGQFYTDRIQFFGVGLHFYF